MSIADLVTASAHAEVQLQAAVQVQKLAMESTTQAADAMQQMLDTVQIVQDPNLGQHINLTA